VNVDRRFAAVAIVGIAQNLPGDTFGCALLQDYAFGSLDFAARQAEPGGALPVDRQSIIRQLV
jgi:hypothetical protein